MRTFADTARRHDTRPVRQRWAGRADAKGAGCSACLRAETDKESAVFDEETDCLQHCDGVA